MRHVVLFIIGLFFSLAGCDLLGVGDGPSGPRLEGIPGKIVFGAHRIDETGKRTDDGNIYVMDGDGLQQLTDVGKEAFAFNPVFSPDGTQIAFSACIQCTTLGPSLYLMDADGSNRRLFKRYPSGVSEGVVGWDPVWSPSGDRLAYSRCMNCQFGRNYEVFVAEVEGRTFEPSDEIRLTTHLASDAGPAWSPDGEHIVFASNRAYVQTDDPRRSDLYRVHANGSGLQRIAKNIRIGESLWSPDGKHIAIEETKESIRLLNVGNGQVDTLGVELPSNVRFHHVVDWAANGSMLLLASDDDQDRLIAMNPEGGQTQNVPFPTDMRLQGVDWFVEPNN